MPFDTYHIIADKPVATLYQAQRGFAFPNTAFPKRHNAHTEDLHQVSRHRYRWREFLIQKMRGPVHNQHGDLG